MKSCTLVSALAAVGLVGATPAHSPAKRSLQPVKAKGNAFYVGDKRWYMRGLDYQPGGAAANIDPLADPDICLRDIKEFEDLGINTIRVYAVDNSKDHDKCMAALDEAGIYLVLDVNNPEYSINRADPHISYNADYLQSVFATVEMFAKYDNVAAFFSGNEVINDEKDTDKAAPYVKAVTRDIKNYINSRGLRKIPVGYSAADVEQNRRQTADYFNCGSDDMRSDFFAFNDYSWCNSNYQTSGWDAKVKNFTDYGLPIFLSEWGCIKNRPREFEEIEAMMSKEMTKVYSGGLMYEYSLEDNNYGIVKIQNDKVNRKDEFKIFKEALKKYPTPTGDGGASSETHAVDCPAKDKNWQVDSKEIPNMPEQAQKYMKKGSGDGPGLKGKGSQTAGDSGTASGSAAEGKASPTGESQDDEDAAVSLNNMGMGSMVVTGVTMFMMLVGTAAL